MALFLAVPTSIVAESLFTAGAPVRSSLLSASSAQTPSKRSRLVALNEKANWIASPTAESSITTDVNLFDDLSLPAVLEQVISPGPGRHVLRGHIEGHAGSYFLLACENNVIAGTVFVPKQGRFQIRYAGNGLHEVSESDPTRPPTCGVQDENDPHPVLETKALSIPTAKASATASTVGSAVTIAEVLVLYTVAARDGAGGEAGINTLIDLAVAEANLVYENSRVNLLLRLAGKSKVSYDESGVLATDLSRLANPKDGYLDEAANLRAACKADMVCLLVEASDGPAGIAYLTAKSTSAFSVVQRQYASGYYTFVHELGHNFGCAHDRPNASGTGAYSFSYGYSFYYGWWQYGTVMSYTGERIPYFSSPLVQFEGLPVGLAGKADNAKTMNLRAATVAAFCAPAGSTFAPTVRISSPINQAKLFTGTNIVITAEATNRVAAISRVEFYVNGELIGTDTGRPFDAQWTNSTVGDFTLTAKAIDTNGLSAISSPITVHVRPVNDRFDNRQSLSGTNLTVNIGNEGATIETKEPIPVYHGTNSVWFTWTAPMTGPASYNLQDYDFSPYAAVYTGTSLTNLTLVSAWSNSTPAVFEATAGVAYQIVVGGTTDYYPTGHATMTWQQYPLLADDFCNATEILGYPYRISGDNTLATAEPGEESSDSNANGREVWWRWTAPSDGQASISAGVAGWSVTRVFLGDSISNLTTVATSSIIQAGDYRPIAWFNARAGMTYYIAFDGAYDWRGPFDFGLDFVAGQQHPPNDDFANRVVLIGSNFTVNATTIGATREPDEPGMPGGYGDPNVNSVWWTWTSPFSGRIKIDTTDYRSYLCVYTGRDLQHLTKLVGGSQSVALEATEGMIYQIRLDSTEGFTTDLSLWSNDDFANRAVLSGVPVVVTESTALSTKETGEPTHGGMNGTKSVWFTWTSAFDGYASITVNLDSQYFCPLLGVYTGESLASLSSLGQAASFAQNPLELRVRVTNGMNLQIAVDGYDAYWGIFLGFEKHYGSEGQFTLRITDLNIPLPPRPANDDFTNRIAISGSDLVINASNAEATREAGEPDHNGSGGYKSVWWEWTAPLTGRVTIDPSASEIPIEVAVYTGTAVTNLVFISTRPQLAESSVSFDAVEGTKYQVAIDSFKGNGIPGYGAIHLHLVETPAPENDNFATPCILTGNNVSVTANATGASLEAGEPTAAAYFGPSLWYKWTAPANGAVQIGVTDYATAIVYTGPDLLNLSCIGATDYWGPMRFQATAGRTYRISVRSNPTVFGPFTMTLQFTPIPVNDAFENRLPAAGNFFILQGCNISATKQPGESASHSVWWTWTAPANGTLKAIGASDYSSSFSLYIGSSIDNLTPVTGSYDWSTKTSTFDLAIGTTYQICIDGNWGEAGNFDYFVYFSAPPPNDNFANRETINITTNLTIGLNTYATREPGEPSDMGSAGHTIWYSWTAPSSGYYRFSAETSDFGPQSALAVYTGDNLANLVLRGWGVSPGIVCLPVQAGTTYTLCIDSMNPQAGGFVRLGIQAIHANDAFAQRYELTGTNTTAWGTNTEATTESGEPIIGAGHTLWWTWTAPMSGLVRISFGSYYTAGQVFTGDSVSNLTLVGSGLGGMSFAAVAGTAYQISLDAAQSPGLMSLSLTQSPAPANDAFADAIPLSGAIVQTNGSNVGATREINEPSSVSTNSSATVWWTWTAPTSGRATISVSGRTADWAASGFAATYAVYTGDALTNLSLVSSGITQGSFPVIAGETYRIALDGNGGAMGILSLSLVPTPINDNFSAPQVLTGYFAHIEGSSVGATTEVGEAGHVFDPDGASVWFAWQAPAAGTVTINYSGPDFYPGMAVYIGTNIANLELITDNAFQGSLNFNAEEGTSYAIVMAGCWGGGGNYTFDLMLDPGDRNDNFAHRIPLRGTNLTVLADNSQATKERGEPNHGGVPGGHSLWWAYTAPTNGSLRINYSQTAFKPSFGIYTGTSLSVLKAVATANDPVKRQLVFATVSQTTYLIAVDGPNGNTGSILMQMDHQPAPANDHFTNSIRITGDSLVMTANNRGATKQTGEPNHDGLGGSHSLWWNWIATSSSTVMLSAQGEGFQSYLAVYTGARISALKLITNNYSGGILAKAIVFTAKAGTNYQIAIDSALQDFGPVTLTFTTLAKPLNDNATNAVPLNGTQATSNGSNAGATREAWEPINPMRPGGRSVWWKWTANATGQVFVSTAGSSFDTILSVYTGSKPTNLTVIAFNDDAPGVDNTSELSFSAQAGKTYWLSVDGFEGAMGDIQLRLTSPNSVSMPLAKSNQPVDRTPTNTDQGTLAQWFVVQTSTNLTDWESISTNLLSAPLRDVVPKPNSSTPMRFYRAIPRP